MKKILLMLLMFSSLIEAKMLGNFGQVFEIIEADLLESIQNKLQIMSQNGSLENHQKNIQSKMLSGIQNPLAVSGLTKTKVAKTFAYDPSLKVPYDLKDHKGQVFIKANTLINPLESMSLSKPLIFIDGEDCEQVNWAMAQKELNPKIILVKGSPFKLMAKHNWPIYFDQGGKLIKKFGIKQIPARITQNNKVLMVEEVLLKAHL